MTNPWMLLQEAKQLFPIGTHVKIKDTGDTGDFVVTGHQIHFTLMPKWMHSNKEFNISVACTGCIYSFNRGQMSTLSAYNFKFLERV